MRIDGSAFVIAEAGVNHNGDLSRAKALVEAATVAGADAVKFQTFRADQVVSRNAPKADYQRRTTGDAENQLEMIRKLELSEKDHEELIRHAKRHRIEFLSTPFDILSLELLTQRLGLRTVKVASGDITNAPFLLAVARAAERVILSTGMSTMEEVAAALGILAFGFTEPGSAVPKQSEVRSLSAAEKGREALKSRVVLLHCTTEYPAPAADVNLRAMDAMADEFGLPVGYSDHTAGIHIALAAIARGAKVIEKHFTLDRTLPGPDHAASIEPGDLRQMVAAIREIESALGDGVKRPTPSELKNREVARRSLTAARAIDAREVFTEENLACKRPGTGLTPFAYWDVLGQPARRSYEADEALDG